jgi:chromosomal replication initiator protein
LAIIQKKADFDGTNIPDDVATFIAQHVTSNVRELEGTLIKLIASASFNGHDITLDAAQEIFGDVINNRDIRLTTAFITEQVAQKYGVSSQQLTAHSRKRDVTTPRNVAMYLCKKWTKLSMRSIGLDFGGRDYSTVLHAHKKIESEMAENESLRRTIAVIEQAIKPLADA